MRGVWMLALAAAPIRAAYAEDPAIEQAQYSWSRSPHGKMLEHILPPSIRPADLPESQSTGARLTVRYCVQCHYLPNPRMHTAARWETVVERMVWRMQGQGNMGTLMKEMMADVRAPSTGEVHVLTAYLRRYGQREIDPQHPALAGAVGRMFSIACSQCHALPDPASHTGREWPVVIARMEENMAWSNRVVGASALRTTPELDTAKITQLLQRYARDEK